MQYLYVCHFSSGHIKMGRSIESTARIKLTEQADALLAWYQATTRSVGSAQHCGSPTQNRSGSNAVVRLQPRPSLTSANKITTMSAACAISNQVRRFSAMPLERAPLAKKQTDSQPSKPNCHHGQSDIRNAHG